MIYKLITLALLSSVALADEIYDQETGKYSEIKESNIDGQLEVYDYEKAAYKYYEVESSESTGPYIEIQTVDVNTNEIVIHEIEEE